MSNAPNAIPKTVNQILIEMLMLNVGKVSAIIETQGRTIFGQNNLLANSEINDYSLEFLELLTLLLQSGASLDRRGREFKALRQFFSNCSQQIQLRGGTMDEFVRYIQFLQRVLIDNLDADQAVDFASAREALLLLAGIFNDVLVEVFHIYLEGKESTIQAQQEEDRAGDSAGETCCGWG